MTTVLIDVVFNSEIFLNNIYKGTQECQQIRLCFQLFFDSRDKANEERDKDEVVGEVPKRAKNE